jgi:hypothetical protein
VDLTSPSYDRLSLVCRACGVVDGLDVPQGVMTPARLNNMWPRCAGCGSQEIEIVLRATESTQAASATESTDGHASHRAGSPSGFI